MSPTISSSKSSIVTMPSVPPYSSVTIAMWSRVRLKELRIFESCWLLNTKNGGCMISRSAGALPSASDSR